MINSVNSFYPSSIRMWNSLSDSVKASTSTTAFKSSLDSLSGGKKLQGVSMERNL